MKIRVLFIFGLFVISHTHLFGQDLLINEVMYSNIDVISDESGEYSDWIELYNASNESINLQGYALSDDENDLMKWVFPETVIEPLSFVVVFANENEEEGNLMTNFKLDASGEALLLSNPSASVLDQYDIKARPSNISIGRIPDGGSTIGELLYPSPEYSNLENNIITFSEPPGYYTEDISLTLENHSGEADDIYYTLDGSVPNDESLLYSTSIELSDRAGDANDVCDIITTLSAGNFIPETEVFKINVLRFASFRNGIQTSPIYSKSYLIDSNMFNRYELPIISLITEWDNLFDYDTGIYVPGVNFNSGNSQWTGNYFMRGIEWERDVHVEFFEQNGDLAFQQDAGVRTFGGKSRGSRQKSLKLFARKEYGQRHFSYPFFPESEKDEYKRIVLRTATACWNETVVKDALTHDICAEFDMESMQSRWAILFVNGEYWGLHGIRDNLDTFHLADKIDEDPDEINILTQTSGQHPDFDESYGVIEGSNEDYLELMHFIETNDLSLSENYDYVKSQIDVTSMINYYCSEIFFNNKDWIRNNNKVWKSNSSDAKWRWLFYDIDAGWGYNINNWNLLTRCLSPVETFTNNPPYATMLFRNMMESPEYKEDFLKRMACLLMNEFTEESLLQKIDEFEMAIESSIDEQSLRWDRPINMSNWIYAIDNTLIDFAEQRQGYIIDHIEAEFDIIFTIEEYDCEPVIIVGVEEEYENDFLLYPNPVRDVLQIMNRSTNMAENIEIYDNTGRLVLSTRFSPSVDIAGFSSGLYFVKIIGLENTITRKIMKE